MIMKNKIRKRGKNKNYKIKEWINVFKEDDEDTKASDDEQEPKRFRNKKIQIMRKKLCF